MFNSDASRKAYLRKTIPVLRNAGFKDTQILKELGGIIKYGETLDSLIIGNAPVIKYKSPEPVITPNRVIEYNISGWCENTHKKRKTKKRKAICSIEGIKYCVNCAISIMTKDERKQLKRERNIKKAKRRRNVKKVNAKEDWVTRVKKRWKDTPEQRKIRKSQEYKEWRLQVLERDNYKCQHCGQDGGLLHCHHIKSFKFYEDLRFDINNGLTLCGKCHEELHLSRFRKPRKLL